MDFRLTKMQVLSLNFTEEKQGDPKSDSRLRIDAAMESSEQNPLFARMVIDIALAAPGRYDLSAKLAFILSSKRKSLQKRLRKAL